MRPLSSAFLSLALSSSAAARLRAAGTFWVDVVVFLSPPATRVPWGCAKRLV